MHHSGRLAHLDGQEDGWLLNTAFGRRELPSYLSITFGNEISTWNLPTHLSGVSRFHSWADETIKQNCWNEVNVNLPHLHS